MKKFFIAASSTLAALLVILAALVFSATPLFATPTTVTDEDAGFACAACAGIFLVVPLIVLVINLIIGVWMYKDAQRRGNPQAVLWLVVGVIFSIVGLVIYLAVRKSGSAPPPPV